MLIPAKMLLGAETWNTTAQEAAASYPCDALLAEPFDRLTRAIDVHAPPEAVWPWLRQLREAPYSYDWIDNWGRRSPRELNPDLGEIEPGHQILSIFEVLSVVPGREFTAEVRREGPRKVFGRVATTYAVVPHGQTARIVVRIVVSSGTLARRIANTGLGVGDLVMMRKQLKTLADLAERDARVSRSARSARS